MFHAPYAYLPSSLCAGVDPFPLFSKAKMMGKDLLESRPSRECKFGTDSSTNQLLALIKYLLLGHFVTIRIELSSEIMLCILPRHEHATFQFSRR